LEKYTRYPRGQTDVIFGLSLTVFEIWAKIGKIAQAAKIGCRLSA